MTEIHRPHHAPTSGSLGFRACRNTQAIKRNEIATRGIQNIQRVSLEELKYGLNLANQAGVAEIALYLL
jgi:hypothetical protein